MAFMQIVISGDWGTLFEMTEEREEDNEETALKRAELVRFFSFFYFKTALETKIWRLDIQLAQMYSRNSRRSTTKIRHHPAGGN